MVIDFSFYLFIHLYIYFCVVVVVSGRRWVIRE